MKKNFLLVHIEAEYILKFELILLLPVLLWNFQTNTVQ